MKVCDEPPPAPDGMEIITPAYDIVGYIYSTAAPSIFFDQPVKLTLSFNPEWLPENICSIFIGWYDPEQGWTELELASDGTAEARTISSWINHASIFAILVELEPAEPAPEKFELEYTVFSTAQVQTGEPVTVSVIIQNTGELSGTYTLDLEINDRIEQTREVVLAGGESTQISFIIVKDEPGVYDITVGGFTVVFTVLNPVSSPSSLSIYWWILPFAAIATGLIIYILARKSRTTPRKEATADKNSR